MSRFNAVLVVLSTMLRGSSSLDASSCSKTALAWRALSVSFHHHYLRIRKFVRIQDRSSTIYSDRLVATMGISLTQPPVHQRRTAESELDDGSTAFLQEILTVSSFNATSQRDFQLSQSFQVCTIILMKFYEN